MQLDKTACMEEREVHSITIHSNAVSVVGWQRRENGGIDWMTYTHLQEVALEHDVTCAAPPRAHLQGENKSRLSAWIFDLSCLVDSPLF